VLTELAQDTSERVAGAPATAGTTSSLNLDPQDPWPGLAAYDEGSADYFHGRSREAAELSRLIRLAPLTALYGKSGLGKSSLLQAGLFPLLRAAHYLPVNLRLDYAAGTVDDIFRRVRNRLVEELAAAQADFPPPGDEGLWQYLHHRDVDLWSVDNYPLVPVLVFDQFEELFSRNIGRPDRITDVFNWLGDLIENRIPAQLAHADSETRATLDFTATRYRIVLSFREDFLAEVQTWGRSIPSLLRNFLRLEPMSRERAIEAVKLSGKAVLKEGVAPCIVDFVGGQGGSASPAAAAAAATVIEPVLLSLCCYQLNRARGEKKIDRGLVERVGHDILDSFYRGALDDPDVKGEPDVSDFIERYLIQGDHFRGTYPRAEALNEGRLTERQLAALTDRHRLLRVVPYADTARIELIHDRLVPTVRKARDERRAREQREEQERRAKKEQEEQERRAKQEQARLEEAARIERERLQLQEAEAQRQKAEAERQKAEAERQKADAEREKAEAERQKADAEREKADAEREKADAEARATRATAMLLGVVVLLALAAAFFSYRQWSEADRQRAIAVTESREADWQRGEAEKERAEADRLRAKAEEQRVEADRQRADAVKLQSRFLASTSKKETLRGNSAFGLLLAQEAFKPLERAGLPASQWPAEADGALHTAVTATVPSRVLAKIAESASRAVISPAASLVATISRNHVVRIWDRAGKPIGEFRHEGPISSAEFSPDGTQLVTGSFDDTAKIWKSADGLVVHLEHDDTVNYAAFNAVGTRVVTACDDRKARIWTTTGTKLATIETPDAVRRAEFSPDGTRVVTAGGNAARVWTVAGKRVAELPHPDVKIATFSPDGNLIVTVASSGDRPLRLWTSSGKELKRLSGHQDVQYVAFSPPRLQGLRLVTASADQTARVWDTRDGKLVATLKHEGRVSFAAFSKDGTQILTLGDDSVVRVWTENGLKLATLQLRARAGAALFDSDTTIITVAGSEFRAWDLGQGQFTGVHPSKVVSARFHPSENRVLTVAKDRVARLWAPATKSFVRIGEPNVRLASFSEDGQRVLIWSGSGRIELLGLDGKRSELGLVRPRRVSFEGRHVLAVDRRGAALWSDDGTRRVEIPAIASQASVSSDGTRIVIATMDGGVSLWNVSRNMIAQLRDAGMTDSDRSTEPKQAGPDEESPGETASSKSNEARILRFSPDGKRLLILYADGELQVFTSDGAPIGALHVDTEGARPFFPSATFSPDGTHVLIDDKRGNVQVWSVADQLLVSPEHKAPLRLARFDPTGARFLAVEDKTVVFRNTGGQQVLALQHDSPVQRIDFSPRDDRILTASADGSIRIWNSEGRQLAEIVVGDRIEVVAFNADGAQLFVVTGDSAVRIFNVYSPDETRRIAASLDIEPLAADERQRFSILDTAPETQPPAAAGSK
jgi:WD40 repeat protein